MKDEPNSRLEDELRPKLDHASVLVDREIRVVESGSVEEVPSGVAKGPKRFQGERIRVEIVVIPSRGALDAVYKGAGSWIEGLNCSTVKVGAIGAPKETERSITCVGAIASFIYRNGEPGLQSCDSCNPITVQ